MRLTLAILGLLVLLAASLAATAQPVAEAGPDSGAEARGIAEARRMAAAMRAHTIDLDGSRQPASIPYHQKMATFFRHFGRSPVDGMFVLDETDRARVAAFATDDTHSGARDAAEHEATKAAICDELAGGPLDDADAVRYLARAVETQQRLERASEARYRALLSTLSAEGRRSIEAYVETEIVPSMATADLDVLSLAAEFPAWAVATVGRMCGDEPVPRPLIASAGHSAGPSSGRVGELGSMVSSNRTGDDLAAGDARPRAVISFARVVRSDELLALLASSALELETVHYRDVGSGSGYVMFTPGADPGAALAAAEGSVRYRKLAEAYALQQGVSAVHVPSADPALPGPGGVVVLAPGAPPRDAAELRRALDPENAARATREELDALALPPCIADERIDQPFTLEGGDAPLIEAACGFRPSAVTVRGERAAIEALRGREPVAEIVYDPPRN